MPKLLATRSADLVLAAMLFLCLPPVYAASAPVSYTRLLQLKAPTIVESSPSYPGPYEASNLLDGDGQTEFASNGKGTNTFVEFEFKTPASLSGFRHVERNDPATVAGSVLVFMDETGKVLSSLPIVHVNERGGVTFQAFPNPVTAKRVRWSVTKLGAGLATVGGADLSFYTAGPAEPAPAAVKIEAHQGQLREKVGDRQVQPLRLLIDYPYLEPTDATIYMEGAQPTPLHLVPGARTVDVAVPAVDSEKDLSLELRMGDAPIVSRTISLKPVRPLQIFLLPHSHVDIGYTALQADVEKKQNSNIAAGLRLAGETAGYPEDARFKWNVEVLWPVENYLRDCKPEEREAFIEAVRSGRIGLDAFYGNILTGLCRPEELLNLMGYATRISKVCGVPIDSAMISDVPGYTWSTVSAMAQAGVKYFSFAPNYFDRMGATMKEWQNRPFWWKSADGLHRVLCWCPSRGYALGHLIGDGPALARFLPQYLSELETNSYPYDMTYLRWNVHGDNGSPDEHLSDVVRDWNDRYVYPHLVISTTANAFEQFEKRYGDKLPVFSGDYTPYWEDGAASSARETALNRVSAERIVQAEVLWSIRNPSRFPSADFQNAWRDVLLYSEHTWGAHNSIGEPDSPFVLDQWKVKQSFALDADKLSHELLRRAGDAGEEADIADAVDVFNTCSWPRTDLVTLSRELSSRGDLVLNDRGEPVPSQRLSSGELAFLAHDVCPLGATRFYVAPGSCPLTGAARAEPARLLSSDLFVRLNEQSGGIKHLFSRLIGRELVETNDSAGFNDYFYLPGSDLNALQKNGTPTIRIKEPGPLVASLVVESSAPGCQRLTREIRVVDGLNRLELINQVDKTGIRAKEGVHFGYAFNVPKATMRMDVGWAVIRPEVDQIPASCKNWFSVQRWLDISNERFGVTWAPVDAPLVEVGGMTANLIGSQTDYRVWIQHLPPTQTIYSWVMNNHWHTNYRAEQEGPTLFRFLLQPHLTFQPEEAAKFGISCSQPLMVLKATGPHPIAPRLRLSSDKVVVTALKPADDGRGWIVRLFGASGQTETVKLTWTKPAPTHFWLSDLSEEPRQETGRSVEVPAWGIVTVRAE